MTIGTIYKLIALVNGVISLTGIFQWPSELYEHKKCTDNKKIDINFS